jgi:polar amino acid transport system substrate-binding protein
MRMITRLAALLLSMSLGSCDFPRDADGTLDRVRSERVLRVGVSESPPWVTMRNGEPGGIEPRLARAFAGSLKAKIAWTSGTESAVIAALKERQLDLVIGGFDTSSHWASEVAATQPYLTTSVIVAAPGASAGRGAVSDGAAIQYPRARIEFAALIAQNDFRPEPVAAPGDGAAVIYDFEARALGLVATETELIRKDLVMFVAPGESGFLYALDRFLATRDRAEILRVETPP